MGLFNLGNRDEYGRQRRIEHRGRYLRASRTGGVSLRAQTRAAGLNLTANTSHGFRVSRTVGRNTQLAFQNGRFILRGRYGSGPTKLNLSKSGISVSTRNELGSFNWLKPRYSSAKVLGMQFRGRTAVFMQAVYAVVVLAIELARLTLIAGIYLLRFLVEAGRVAVNAARALPYALVVARRRMRNAALRLRMMRVPRDVRDEVEGLPAPAVLGGLAHALLALGRGEADLPDSGDVSGEEPETEDARAARDRLGEAVEQRRTAIEILERWRGQGPNAGPLPLWTAMLARRYAALDEARLLPEVLLQLDEACLRDGPRTVLQERLLEIVTDFAGVRMVEPA